MNPEQCYGLCCKYQGQVVRIHDINGHVHVGRIIEVTDESVWLQPVDSGKSDFGFGYNGYDGYDGYNGYNGYDGFDGFGPGFGPGFDGFGAVAAFELAFGFIIGIALASLFFW